MAVDLNGKTGKVDAVSFKEYADKEGNDPNYTNGAESIFSVRLDEENYCEIINLLKAFSDDSSSDDVERGIVSFETEKFNSTTKD